MTRRLLFALACSVILAGGSSFGQAPRAPRPAPLGDEGFGVLLQFLAYDREVPLDARSVDLDSTDAWVRE
jgi:hypothetical protein